MFLTFLFEIKNKQKKDKENKDKSIDEKKKNNSGKDTNKLKKSREKNNTQKKEKKKKEKIQKSLIFKRNKGIFYKGLKGVVSTSHFALFIFIFFIFFTRSVLILGSKTLYLEGCFESYTETSSIFIPDCTKLKITSNLREKEVGEYLYYKYDKKKDIWKIDKKGGLKLRIVDINDYYIFTEVENLNNLVFQNDFLKGQNISQKTKISVPLKHLFNNYEIYFSLNDSVNLLRDKFGIYKEDKKFIDIMNYTHLDEA